MNGLIPNPNGTLSYNTIKPPNPIAGTMVFDPGINRLTVFDGHAWSNVSMEIKYCSLCKEEDFKHWDGDTDHPLFNNNLEYLEWKWQKKQSLVS